MSAVEAVRPGQRTAPRWALVTTAWMAGALATGMVASTLFRWPDDGDGASPGFAEIAGHNLGLAALLVVAGRYVAGPAVVFNCFFLGFVLNASALVHGWSATARLTAVHVPLEVVAWALTWWCAALLTTLTGRAWRARTLPDRREARILARTTLLTALLYLVAAGAEWTELWLHDQGGTFR